MKTQWKETDLDTVVSVRVSTAARKKLERLAAGDKRTLANYVRLVLEAHVEKQALVPDQSESPSLFA